MNAKSTKRAKASERDTLRLDYRRKDLGQGVRGKYFKQHTRAGLPDWLKKMSGAGSGRYKMDELMHLTRGDD